MHYTKNINYSFLLVALITCGAPLKCADFDPFKHLPEESLIKKECSECGYGNFFYRNKKQKSCGYIRDTLTKFNEPDRVPGLIEVIIGGLMGPNGRDLVSSLITDANSSEMKQHVNTLLGKKYSKEEMRQEHTLLAKTAENIHKTRAERKKEATSYKPPHRPEDPY